MNGNVEGKGAGMVDKDTMAAYAANIEKFRDMVTKIGGNSRLDGFLARLPKGAAILDLGCGVGDSAVRMRNAGFTVSCTDASPEMVATANELHGLDAVQKSFSELREEAAYNAVWASFSLLHAPRAEMPANLARIHRAILPGGLFYMGLKLGAGEARDAAGRFYAYFGEEELRQMLVEAGFSVLAAEPDSMVGLLGSPEPCIHITSARD